MLQRGNRICCNFGKQFSDLYGLKLCGWKNITRCHSSTTSAATANFGFKIIDQEEKKERVKTVFSNVANDYDLMNDAMSFFIHRFWKDYYVQKLNIGKNDKVIDVAGGTGDIAFRVANMLQKRPKGHGSITVVDINEKMLDVGKIRADSTSKNSMIKNISWIVADAESLPFDDNSFDKYTIAFGIRNCTDVEKVLAEAYRVLRPNGVFSCLEFGQVSQPMFKRLYDAYSFQIIPVLGQVLVGDFNSYKYLVESIRVFPDQLDFSHMIEKAGFKCVEYEELTCGICNIFLGVK